MRSGSQLRVTIPRPFRTATTTSTPPLSTNRFSLGSESPTTSNPFDDLNWPEDATLVSAVSGYLHIELPVTEPAHAMTLQPAEARRTIKLIHGRSPLGLVKPILAEDVGPAVAKPARVLQLICDERRITHLERRAPLSTSWQDMNRDTPVVARPFPARIRSQGRARNIELPLALWLAKNFVFKYYRRRLADVAVCDGGLSRRALDNNAVVSV
ncbi:hypothetical protein AURDEDRAFT_169320 [Auricularia subglabra TFB-10046 SS5]|nr:hypothetical protein AURDEDRAFT_169320 [Auricularia subglabra TFB-10046 SS5]